MSNGERDSAGHIQRVEFRDVEKILSDSLGGRFGERFEKYRREYYRTLSADKDGFFPAAFPTTVTMELVNRCNLSCVMCYTANHNGTKHTLDLKTINRVLEEGKEYGMPALFVGLGSEALLFKEYADVFRAAKANQVMDLFLITNGTLLDEKASRFLVDEEVPRVLISLDAAMPETYAKIRGKDELNRVERNILKLIEIRNRKNTKLPIVRLSFCVQEANRHEQEMFQAKWHDLVDYIDFQVLSDFSMVDEVLKTGEVQTPSKPLDGRGEKLFCHQPFGYLSIWSNGDVSPCCTYYGKNLILGNVKEKTLKEIWDGERIKTLRREMVGGELNKTCRVCLSQRENMVADLTAFAPAKAAE